MAEQDPNQLLHPRSASADDSYPAETEPGVSIKTPSSSHDGRPPPIKHMSSPTYQSPIRHHQRTPSRSKGVKETLDARSHYGSSEDDGGSVQHINQYIIKQEIGRGSFGAVHLAVDQYGNEFAVKEFSKSRLRKRAQSNLLRKPNQGRKPGHLPVGLGFNSPLHRITSDKMRPGDANNSLSLIKEEIAIMKKLDHHNLVNLIEVLDDPQEDSLYMVLEMCKKGVAMKVGLDERADPYDDETCRCWFRDMILGIEYLHAQGIIHRDIKPDNCLVTSDDVLKIVDFGVSEMFEKQSEMATAKSAGSPAFMPPELCVAKHGLVNGRAADIWSMGVTLYCLRYGHIPFEKDNMIDLYNSIRGEDVPLAEEKDANFRDLMLRILEKDPDKRITLEELRNHPWVTKDGTDNLLSAEDNCANIVEPPTEAEMDHAITGNMAHLMAVMSAVKRFKKSASSKHGRFMEGLFGRDSRLVAPPHPIRGRSEDGSDRRPMEKMMATAGVHRPVGVNDDGETLQQAMDDLNVCDSPELEVDNSMERQLGESVAHWKQRLETMKNNPSMSADPEEHAAPIQKRTQSLPVETGAKGQAHDPLEDRLFLDIGTDPEVPEGEDSEYPVVSESPSAVDENIYELAYQEEMERILARRGNDPSIYMTRRVEHRDDIRSLESIKDAGKYAARSAYAKFQGASSRSYTAVQGWRDDTRPYRHEAAERFYEQWDRGSAYASPWVEAGKQRAKDGGAYAAEYLEPWRQAAKTRLDNSRTAARLGGLYNSGGGGFSSFVSRAHAKWSGDAPGGQSKTNETGETSEKSEPPPEQQQQSQPPAPPPITAEDTESDSPAKILVSTSTPFVSAFKEDAT